VASATFDNHVTCAAESYSVGNLQDWPVSYEGYMAFSIITPYNLAGGAVAILLFFLFHPNTSSIASTTDTRSDIMSTPQKIYDAIIVGGGPAGLSTALGLSRICRPTILFDSGEYRNQGSTAMHTYLTRDGIHPAEFRATARQEIQSKYSAYSTFAESKIVSIKNTEILPGYKGFEAIDSANKTYLGRKLVLATGSEDILPTDIEGYKENWATHM
jgi:hypothetical protein